MKILLYCCCTGVRLRVNTDFYSASHDRAAAACLPCWRLSNVPPLVSLNLAVPNECYTFCPSSLDNICAEPNPSDSRYLDGLHKTYSRHQDFPRTQPKDIVSLFCYVMFCFVPGIVLLCFAIMLFAWQYVYIVFSLEFGGRGYIQKHIVSCAIVEAASRCWRRSFYCCCQLFLFTVRSGRLAYIFREI